MAASVSTPPLLEGNCLASDEFVRLWEEIPDLKHAELIDGIVYLPSPVTAGHADHLSVLHLWIGNYAIETPGCRSSLEATWLMGAGDVPQPDLTLRILPEYGGQSGIAGEYHSGAPELIVEVALSSRSRDFGAKRRLYERTGVREYLIAVPRNRELVGFALQPSSATQGFQPFETDADGVFQSRCFPGLWLDTKALWALDLARMNAVLRQGLATPEHAGFAARLARHNLPASL